MTAQTEIEPRYKLSLAQYALHRKIGGSGNFFIRHAKRLKYSMLERPVDFFQSRLDPIDFAEFTRKTFDIGAVEYVSGFYRGKAEDKAYLKELKTRAEEHGVENVLIMVDGEGILGAQEAADRFDAVERHKKWIDAAAYLGCYAIRAFAFSDDGPSYEERQKLTADGFAQLVDYAASQDIDVVIENKGGLAANAAWLVGMIEQVGHKRLGTLPDFGNFKISETETYDYIQGTREMMPYAKGVSVKAFEFDEHGVEQTFDFPTLMQIIQESGFRGYLGVEFEGTGMSEVAGILKTKEMLEKLIPQYQ
ncbi:MAG: sugar phosphate isomerase/epimerase family protein [Henriciella sp.]|nr:sugar phosphate isomerase/epimerase family protein [Henriciella sp.]